VVTRLPGLAGVGISRLLGVLLASNVDASSLPGIATNTRNTLLLHMQAYKLLAFSSYFSDPLPMYMLMTEYQWPMWLRNFIDLLIFCLHCPRGWLRA
jgi:hypothetical protein